MTEIAIVGIDCRFPRAATTDALWHLLMNRGVATSVVPAARWDIDPIPQRLRSRPAP